MITLTLILAVFIGFTVGLLGGGGSILGVPMLRYIGGMEAKEAIATTLLIVATTSAVGAVQHARAGNVDWRTGAIFTLTAAMGGYTGGRTAKFLSEPTLLLLFATMMMATSMMMFRGRRNMTPRDEPLPIGVASIVGLVVGFVTGMIGVGGGFMVVAALVLAGGMPMHRAVGTTLVVVTLKSFAAFAGYITHVSVNYEFAGTVTAVAVCGTLVGAAMSQRVPAEKLRKGFAVLVLVMAAIVLAQERNIESALAATIPASLYMLWLTRKQRG